MTGADFCLQKRHANDEKAQNSWTKLTQRYGYSSIKSSQVRILYSDPDNKRYPLTKQYPGDKNP